MEKVASMKTVNWNLEKAKLVKDTRNIDFDRIAVMIEEKEMLGVYDVPSREGQKMFVLDYDDYLVCVPFVENEREIFIKTAFRSRKLTKVGQDKL
jgi:hypothetical protein